MELLSSVKSFGGEQRRYKHQSSVLGCEMIFAAYMPPQAANGPVPVIYYLSGLTCTDENFVTKAGAQRMAADLGVAIIAPDTSPRGEDVPDDEEGAWDFGLAAGFYLNATQAPWNKHYHMYDYVVSELPALVEPELNLDGERRAIMGHSMGGHGALTIALKNEARFKSVSAFSPIVAPSQVPWGHKAFGNYLGDDKASWAQYDATELLNADHKIPMFIDQGGADSFLEEQLKPEIFVEKAKALGSNLRFEMRDGYDHSYYYIASFIEEHLRFHAEHL